jgi:hypothetical protein
MAIIPRVTMAPRTSPSLKMLCIVFSIGVVNRSQSFSSTVIPTPNDIQRATVNARTFDTT